LNILQKIVNNNNNNTLLRTRGPYHRHKNTKKWLAIHQRTLQKRCLHMTNIGRSKARYPHHSCIVIRKMDNHSKWINTLAQKMDNHTLAHHTTGISTCPTLRGAKHFPSTSYFFSLCLVCTQCPHIFTTQKQYRWDVNTETTHEQLLHSVSTIQERWII